MWWQMPVTWVDNPIIATISDSAECLLMRLHTAVAETEEPALSPRMVVVAAAARWSERKTKALLAELELRGAIAREGNRVVLIDIFGVGQSLDKVGKRRPIDAARKRKGPESLGLLPEFHADSVLQSEDRDQDGDGDTIRAPKKTKASKGSPMPMDWAPSDETHNKLKSKGIHPGFIAQLEPWFREKWTIGSEAGKPLQDFQFGFSLSVQKHWAAKWGNDFRRENGVQTTRAVDTTSLAEFDRR